MKRSAGWAERQDKLIDRIIAGPGSAAEVIWETLVAEYKNSEANAVVSKVIRPRGSLGIV